MFELRCPDRTALIVATEDTEITEIIDKNFRAFCDFRGYL